MHECNDPNSKDRVTPMHFADLQKVYLTLVAMGHVHFYAVSTIAFFGKMQRDFLHAACSVFGSIDFNGIT